MVELRGEWAQGSLSGVVRKKTLQEPKSRKFPGRGMICVCGDFARIFDGRIHRKHLYKQIYSKLESIRSGLSNRCGSGGIAQYKFRLNQDLRIRDDGAAVGRQ